VAAPREQLGAVFGTAAPLQSSAQRTGNDNLLGECLMKTATMLLGSLALASAGAIAGPALAQPAPTASEEITVTGRYGRVPDSVQSLSQAVSYADLDLSTEAGRAELRHRVALTSRFLCDKLGESDTSTGPVPSCRDAAVRDAMGRVGTIEAHFAPRGGAWVAGPAWAPPYPTEWTTRYP
jgi:UrcA family protein